MLAPEAWEAARLCRTTGKAARLFRDFAYQTETSWSRPRRVVGKAEHLPDGANPRFVVTSLGREKIDARGLYEDLYCARGEMENRIKECQLDLFADRTSSATMQANQLRLWFASMAYVLLSELRRIALRHTQFADATCGTIRLKLLKIGALVRRSVRISVFWKRTDQVRHGLGLSLADRVRTRLPLSATRLPAIAEPDRPRPIQAPAPRHVPARARLRP